jgi:hypothetical protein
LAVLLSLSFLYKKKFSGDDLLRLPLPNDDGLLKVPKNKFLLKLKPVFIFLMLAETF